MRSSKSSLDQTIGSFLSNPNLQHQINIYKLFDQIDLKEYAESFASYTEIESEIKKIRTYMVELEKCFAAGILEKAEYLHSVSNFTKMFKVLLMQKEILLNTS
jgi:hypothetical protein